MKRYQTFRDFSEIREEQEKRRPQISDPIPSRRDVNLAPSPPPSATGITPGMRQQLYGAPLNYIPPVPIPGPSVIPGRSRERSPGAMAISMGVAHPVPPQLATAPSYAPAVDYRSTPLYRRQASSSGRRKVPPTQPPGPRPVQGQDAAMGSVSQYSLQSQYPQSQYPLSPGISGTGGYAQRDYRQADPYQPQTPIMSPTSDHSSSANYRFSPEYARPADYGRGYEQPNMSRSRQRGSPVSPQPDYRSAPGYRPSREYQPYQPPPQNRQNHGGWNGYDGSQGLL